VGVVNIILDLIAGLLTFFFAALAIAVVYWLLSGGLPEVRDNLSHRWDDWLFIALGIPFVHWRFRRGFRRE
jgi:hypothetical protein